MNKVIMYSLFFACFGTLLGSFLGIFWSKGSRQQIGYLLAYTAGIMLGLVCIDILPSILFEYSIVRIIIFFLLGAIITNVFDEVIHKQFELDNKKIDSLKLTGILMFVGLCLHNIPEGIALVSSSLYNHQIGLRMGIVITLHDIPEGLAIAAPLVASGTRKMRAFLISMLSIVFTIFGIFIGLGAYKIMSGLIFVSLALASGSIIYIICKDLIPRALSYIDDKKLTFMIILGMITSLIIINL